MKNFNHIKRLFVRFHRDERGFGTLEIILILAVLILIAIAFRKWIMKWVGDLFALTDQQIEAFKSDGSKIGPSPSGG
ncbi:MAG: hypothetical protein BLM47_09755 [Candidatus Reconcilbacillus cellulovorans]|uniref:Putative Flagellin Flp1-like domain-containing protein n=1 Tax=Candidatus Reconcilbacillus cellulovorans TaxID=1906605 RepID=A0A2A6DZL8_9BACL|nr:MAG: hypothetical protein BLM47_09755 [Candidatus Reconcilbacillus cellulovorans]